MSKLNKLLCCVFCIVVLTCTVAGLTTVSAASKNTVTTSISKIESKAKGFKVTFAKKSKIQGYQVQYSTSSKFEKSKTKTKTVSNAKTNTVTASGLKGCNVKYYVRVRTYKVSNDKKIYSSWSKAKSVTTLNHKYNNATCTKAKVCKYCDKTSGEKLGHKWSSATCTKPKTCSRCKMTSGKALGHKWSANACTKATTCSRCKKSSKALGHKWSAATCTNAKTCSRCKKTSGEKLGHKWSSATCTKAKTCSRCKKTSGEALGHKWSKATCTSAKVCTRCKKTSGEKLGHKWSEATCIKAKTCCECGTTKGSALGHSYSNGVCSRCGDEDSSYVKSYSVNETWIVDGQWEFTVHSAEKHYMCNRYSNRNDMAECVIITYSYKNLGYSGASIDLYLNDVSFNVYDGDGEAAEMYPCTHTKSPKECSVGTKCSNAQEAYAFYNDSSELTLTVEHYTSNGLGNQKAQFVIPVN